MWMHLYLKMDSLIKCFLFSNVFLFLGHWWRTGGDWDECWSKRRMTFPPNWCNSGFKGGRCPGCCKRCESDVTYDQEWWPILGICALQLSHPKCTHTAVNTHTHREHIPGAVGSHLCCGARGAVEGSVPCSRAPQSWYWGWRERCTFTPPTYNSCRQPLGYESDSLTIGPRLPPCHMLYWWGFFMTTSVMLKRSWKLAVMHDLYSGTMKQTVSV